MARHNERAARSDGHHPRGCAAQRFNTNTAAPTNSHDGDRTRNTHARRHHDERVSRAGSPHVRPQQRGQGRPSPPPTDVSTSKDNKAALTAATEPKVIKPDSKLSLDMVIRAERATSTTTVTANRPIRMLSAPRFVASRPDASKRPVNTYRGKNSIKKLISNPILRSVIAGKGVPKVRKKVAAERMDLRLAGRKVTK